MRNSRKLSMIMNEHRRYEIALSLLPCLKPADARLLFEKAGSAEAVFSDKKLRCIEQLNPKVIQEIVTSSALKRADKEIEYCLNYNIQVRFITDTDYPYRLAACQDAPLVLYSKGISNLNAKRIVSIVGTRRATRQGVNLTEKLVRELAANFPDLIIVSGLAYGIDITANSTAVSSGINTVAVVAHGLQEIYPAIHRKTALEIIKNGSILTELPYGTPPEPFRFIQRNRIVAGLCDACIVMESAEKGGSMITAEMASDYGRDVFAYPGRPADERSAGCNLLIKKQLASLATSADDILTMMNWQKAKQAKAEQATLFPDITPIQKLLIERMQPGELKKIEDFSGETGLSMAEILSNLMQLELNGQIESLPGGSYLKKC